MKIVTIICCITSFILMSCSSVVIKKSHAPKNKKNICKLFEELPHWEKHLNKSSSKWKVPKNVMMSIMYHESSFRNHARPFKRDKYGNIKLLSSAYGYAQAIDSTWQEYKESTNNYYAKRYNFKDAIDFIGWYIHKSNKVSGIPKYNSEHNYLAYHEGHYGYKKRKYLKKKWLMSKSKYVKKLSKKYKRQLLLCS